MTMEADADVQKLCHRGELEEALTLVLHRYGPQLLGYLTALSSPSQAREIYSMLAEDLWRGLPAFEWRCSLRAWAYTIARNARGRYFVAEQRRDAHEEIAAPVWLRELTARTRSPTPLHLRSEVKDAMRALRERLSEEEQTLLMLRVDRGLSWQELAVVLDEQPVDEDARVVAARLRQRFQTLKDKLRALARAEGLLADGST